MTRLRRGRGEMQQLPKLLVKLMSLLGIVTAVFFLFLMVYVEGMGREVNTRFTGPGSAASLPIISSYLVMFPLLDLLLNFLVFFLHGVCLCLHAKRCAVVPISAC